MEASHGTADEIDTLAFSVGANVVFEGGAGRIDCLIALRFGHFVQTGHVEGEETAHTAETMEEVFESRFVARKFAHETRHGGGAANDVETEIFGLNVFLLFETIVHRALQNDVDVLPSGIVAVAFGKHLTQLGEWDAVFGRRGFFQHIDHRNKLGVHQFAHGIVHQHFGAPPSGAFAFVQQGVVDPDTHTFSAFILGEDHLHLFGRDGAFAEIDDEIGVGVATDGEFPVRTHRFGHAAQEIAEKQVEHPRAAGRKDDVIVFCADFEREIGESYFQTRKSQVLNFFAGRTFVNETTQLGFVLGKRGPGFLDAFCKRAFDVAREGEELVAIVEQRFRIVAQRIVGIAVEGTKEVFGGFAFAVEMIECKTHAVVPEFVFLALFVPHALEHTNGRFIVLGLVFFAS